MFNLRIIEMEKSDILLKLEPIFLKVFHSDIVLNEKVTAMDVNGWDSLNHINLLATIEEEFAIKFTIKEMRSLLNVGDLVTAIKSKI
jgi:acyl carrier protein